MIFALGFLLGLALGFVCFLILAHGLREDAYQQGRDEGIRQMRRLRDWPVAR